MGKKWLVGGADGQCGGPELGFFFSGGGFGPVAGWRDLGSDMEQPMPTCTVKV